LFRLEVDVKSTLLLLLSAAVALLSLAGCPAALPLMQRAQPVCGTAIGAGGGYVAGVDGNFGVYWDWGPALTLNRFQAGDIFGTVAFGNGRQSGFFDLGLTSGAWTTGPDSGRAAGRPFVQAGLQHLLFSLPGRSYTSILFTFGYPRLLDLALLQDIGPHFTGALGFGFNGATAAVALHVRPEERLQCSASGCFALSPWAHSRSRASAASLNLGLEYLVSSAPQLLRRR
jgi:hypothetical protein